MGGYLTFGMATHDDPDGVQFTLRAAKLYHHRDGVEYLVVDNLASGCARTKAWCAKEGARYVHYTERAGTAAPRNQVFALAETPWVMCVDSHIMLAAGTLARFIATARAADARGACLDLFQGPLLAEDGGVSTHFHPLWRERMYGVWATDPRHTRDMPFDIPMQGLGLFAMRKDAWPEFSAHFRGFGGEEGYIHEKVRQRGGRTLCLPWLRWWHRFHDQSKPTTYRNSLEDRLVNYLVGWRELGLNTASVLDHFGQYLSGSRLCAVAAEAAAVQPVQAAQRRPAGRTAAP